MGCDDSLVFNNQPKTKLNAFAIKSKKSRVPFIFQCLSIQHYHTMIVVSWFRMMNDMCDKPIFIIIIAAIGGTAEIFKDWRTFFLDDNFRCGGINNATNGKWFPMVNKIKLIFMAE